VRSSPSLPSFLALRAFDAVARHGSMTGAKAELLITQSAISHHIRALEADLGVPLFTRHARGVVLTAAGSAYHAAVEAAFATIAAAASEIKAAASTSTVRISVLPSFAAHWLMPRLARFRSRHPDIGIELDSTLDQARFDDGVDFAIRYGDGVWPGTEARLLMRERLSPVVATNALGALAALPILMTSKGFEWRAWSDAMGRDFADAPRLQVTDYNVALQAALNGEGVAMGRLRLMQGRIDSGELAAPYGPPVESPAAAYWCVHPRQNRFSRAAALFIDWLDEETLAAA